MTPTQRTLQRCREMGVQCDVVERWIQVKSHPGGGVRKDLFGFIDVVVLGMSITGIQATSGSNGAARLKKIRDECRTPAMEWIKAGGAIEIWAWRKLAKAVDRRYWHPRVTIVTLDDLQ